MYKMDFATSFFPSCRMIGGGAVESLKFQNMEGFYYRAAPAEGSEPEPVVLPITIAPEPVVTAEPIVIVVPTEPAPEPVVTAEPIVIVEPVDPEPEVVPEPIGELEQGRPTVDCWTAECGYCANLDCAVQYDLSAGEVVCSSQLKYRVYNSIVLYNRVGDVLGTFRWSLRGFSLDGCITCGAETKIPFTKGGSDKWSFSLAGGVVSVKTGGVAIFEQGLAGECAAHYADVGFFAFMSMPCSKASFEVADAMGLGAAFDLPCAEVL